MAARKIDLIRLRKQELAAESATLRGDLDNQMRHLAPMAGLLAKGYQFSLSAAAVWNIATPLAAKKKWKVSSMLLGLIRERFK